MCVCVFVCGMSVCLSRSECLHVPPYPRVYVSEGGCFTVSPAACTCVFRGMSAILCVLGCVCVPVCMCERYLSVLSLDVCSSVSPFVSA